MYGWIFRHLPGPTALKIIELGVLLAGVVFALFTWVFPWAADTFTFLSRDPNFN